MSGAGLEELGKITQAVFTSQQAKLQEILRRENQLRGALRDLQHRRRHNMGLPDSDLAAPRAIGVDIAWQGLADRMRMQLNIELAQVLAVKADRMAGLRRAFGRKTAMESLIAQERVTTRKSRDKAETATREALMILGRWP